MTPNNRPWDKFGVDPDGPCPTPRQWFDWDVFAFEHAYDRSRIIATAKDKTYTTRMIEVGFAEDGLVVIQVAEHASRSKMPVPVGRLMFWWEPDHQRIVGVGRREWSAMSKREQARTEAQLQLEKWLPITFFEGYAQWHEPKMHGAWRRKAEREQQDEHETLEEHLRARNEYWRRKLGFP